MLSPASLIDMRVTRVTIDPDVMGGMPCIRGLRIPVACGRGRGPKCPPRFSPNFLSEAGVTEALRYAAVGSQ